MASAGVPPLRTGDWSSTPTCMESGMESGMAGLVDPLRLPLPLPVAQHELLDLAGGGLRQLSELDGGRRLEVGDVLLAELDDVPLGGALVRLQRDERLGPLAPFLV